MKKYLAVVVVLLFIGLAFAPSINANVSKESLVEFTTEVCGLNGGKQTVRLTQSQADEVEALFDTIGERLDATDIRKEAEEIFKEAVVELDKYGLLGGLSVKQAQKLVIGNSLVSNNQRILSRKSGISKNIFCILVATATTANNPYSFCISAGPIYVIGWALWILLSDIGFKNLAEVIFALAGFFTIYNPFRFMNGIIDLNCDWEIVSLGLKGLVTIEKDDYFLIFLGFTGLMFYSLDDLPFVNKHYFLGFCLAFA